MKETELQDHLKQMETLFEEQRKLDRARGEAEKQQVVIESTRLQEAIEAKYRRELAAAEERAEKLRLELKQKDLAIDKVTAEIEMLRDELELSKQKREMTADESALISILTSKGYWKPVPISYLGGSFDGNSKYEGVEKVPHSLTTLAAAGVLDDDAQGLYKLYLVLATTCDTERPRFQQIFPIDDQCKDYINNPARILFMKTDEIERAFIASTEAKETMEKLKRIQGILREFGEVLVKKGALAP